MIGTAGVLDEKVLVAQAREGDMSAFEELYRTHVDRVYALCLRLVSDVARAEELTQDSFVRAWEKLQTFRSESAFSSWLHRLTVNVVIEHRRSEGRRASKERELTETSAPQSSESPGKAEERIDLERALASLPEGARLVFLLHDVEGYQHQEIAEVTGSAVGTSKAQLHRARKLLREALRR
jgi:RNA polymerase sigma-70 factor (ECF subfamily)